jgi:hypothetical protein
VRATATRPGDVIAQRIFQSLVEQHARCVGDHDHAGGFGKGRIDRGHDAIEHIVWQDTGGRVAH